MTRRLARVVVRVLAIACGAVLLVASPAAADPPQPTDYRTEVRTIDPAVPGLVVAMVGGDSMVRLRAPVGHTVVVLGYKGEAYLVVHPDGRVEEDHASYTYRTSRSRYGSDVGAEQGDVTDLRTVATDGSWAWHDHRGHLMSTVRPLGRAPGDQVAEGVLPLVVDGVAVRVVLATFWVPAPSHVPGAMAAALALVVVVLVARVRGAARGRATRASMLVAFAAVLAVVVGWSVGRGLPAHVGARPVERVLPVVALVTAIVAVGLAPMARIARVRREAVAGAACLLAALAILEWGWWRRAVFTKPVLPTTLPAWFDRAGTAAAIVLAVGAALLTWRTLVPRDPARSGDADGVAP